MSEILQNPRAYVEAEGRALFNKLLRESRAQRSILLPKASRRGDLLDLETLVSLVPVQAEHTVGMVDVPVDKIIGTEGRSQDFLENFMPRHIWMLSRWVKVYEHLFTEGISEPLSLVEYGGYYFVRDGNHRVSVAKHSGIDFLTASVLRYEAPVGLTSCCLNAGGILVFSEKYEFHKRTGVFNILEDGAFQVKNPKSWKKLEKEIYVNSRSWFVRYFHREPADDAEFVRVWYDFYKISVEHIRQRSLELLFPGMYETDVFVEMVEFWNRQSNPDSFWIGDIYEQFEHYIRRKRVILSLRQMAHGLFSRHRSAEDAKSFFLHSTHMAEFVPDFKSPLAGRKLFLMWYKQVFRFCARYIQESTGVQPSLQAIDNHWYERWYKPIVQRYRAKLYPVAFQDFYMDFSKRYFVKVIRGKLDMEACLQEYESRLVS